MPKGRRLMGKILHNPIMQEMLQKPGRVWVKIPKNRRKTVKNEGLFL